MFNELALRADVAQQVLSQNKLAVSDVRKSDDLPVPAEDPVERQQKESVERLRVGRRVTGDEPVRPGGQEGAGKVVALVGERRQDVVTLIGKRDDARPSHDRCKQYVRAAPTHAAAA